MSVYYTHLSLNADGQKQFETMLARVDSTVKKCVDKLIEKAEVYKNKAGGKTYVWDPTPDNDWQTLGWIKDLSDLEQPVYDEKAGMTFIDMFAQRIPERDMLYCKEGDGKDETENMGELEYNLTFKAEKKK